MQRYPDMQGVLFDLPEVVAGVPEERLKAGGDRLRVEAGSFFEQVPQGCDAYMMKHIIHDWSDEHCRMILRLVREQLPAEGRVLVCEQVMPDGPGPSPTKMLDIEMLVMTVGGRERTPQEFAALFASAGLKLGRVVTTPTPICVIEALSRLNTAPGKLRRASQPTSTSRQKPKRSATWRIEGRGAS